MISPHIFTPQTILGFQNPQVLKELLLEESSNLVQEIENLECQRSKLAKKLKVLRLKIEKREPYALPINPTVNLKDSDLIAYLLNLNLPSSVYSIIKYPEYSMAFLLQSGLLKPNLECDCKKTMKIGEVIGEGNYAYGCVCGLQFLVLERSIWKGLKLSPSKLLASIMLWLLGAKITSAHALLESKTNQSLLHRILESEISAHFLRTLPKFRGIVEIDESSFKYRNGRLLKRDTEKWVFGLYERERKLIYMEVVSNRFSSTLVPIVQKICEPGTTIISDQWAAYKRLEELGFPHYSVDHSRFFVNPHSREIHTQNIEISWGWAKYEIKRQNRDMLHLQDLVNVFSWKRQFKSETNKKNELIAMINAVCEIFKEVQEKKT